MHTRYNKGLKHDELDHNDLVQINRDSNIYNLDQKRTDENKFNSFAQH